MAIVFGLLTALSNAFSVTTQHIASTSDAEKSSGLRLVLYLVRHPLWLLGWVGMVASLIFQSLALHFGPLSVIQPLLVTELIIALALRRVWLHQSIRAATWFSAVVTGVGLVIFLVATAPSGSAFVPTTTRWTVPVITCVGVVILLVLFAQRGSPARRTALFASATAITWALLATFIKATTDSISADGWLGALSHWPVWALCACGILGIFCEQSALHVGPLSVSQPFIVIVDPIISVALGVWLYREHFHSGLLHVGVGGLAFAVMCVGIVALTRTAPPSINADVHRI
jgi:hypothetical protein